MNGQAFIGCKISLISRAGIRYEGILYTIDANNSTVALSKVKSFGTEDRYSETPVPPRDEIYEYIIFRGSDIQDLHVCEAPKKQPQIMAQDPAILEITGKPPIPAPYSRRRVQFTSRPFQGDGRDGPFVDDIRSGSYYQPHGDDEMFEPWPERVPSRSYYSRNRPYYPMNAYPVNNQPMFYSDVPPRYNNIRRRLSGNNIGGGNGVNRGGGGNGKFGGSVPAPPRRKNATLRRNARRSSSLNIRNSKSGDNGNQDNSRASSGNSRSTNMSGRPDSQNELNFKYDKDYDFESANAEIAKELERLTLEKNSVSTTTLTEPHTNLDSANKKGPTGDSERIENNTELNDESQGSNNRTNMNDTDILTNSSGGGTGNVSNYAANNMMPNGHMTKDNGDNLINYDRSKSFYDNISSEATDRAKGKMIRAINWRDERKLNVETFGFNITSSGGNTNGANNRQVMRRGLETGNSVNTSNSVNRNVHNMGSYYPPFEVHLPNKYYYQSRWFSRRPDYRVPSYVQAWN